MYSVVLMAALATGGANAPACWGHGSGCHGCHGCSGCYGSYGYSGGWACYGGCYGCWGYSGGCYGAGYGCYGCHGCYGCYGCYGSNYAPVYSTPIPVIPPATSGTPTGPMPAPADGKKGGEARVDPTRAKVIVELPAEAKLYIDDQLMKTSS